MWFDKPSSGQTLLVQGQVVARRIEPQEKLVIKLAQQERGETEDAEGDRGIPWVGLDEQGSDTQQQKESAQ